MSKLLAFFERLLQEEPPAQEAVPPLPVMIEAARQEWLAAQRYYDTVSDTDLVDHAVYMIQAAEKKYIYLLKLARREGATHDPYSDAGAGF